MDGKEDFDDGVDWCDHVDDVGIFVLVMVVMMMAATGRVRGRTADDDAEEEGRMLMA